MSTSIFTINVWYKVGTLYDLTITTDIRLLPPAVISCKLFSTSLPISL